MGFVQVVRDWSRKRALKADFLTKLKALRGRPGVGIDIPRTDPVAAAAVQELIDEHPWITVVRFGEAFQLITRPGARAAMNPTTHEQLQNNGFFGERGDDLAAEALASAQKTDKPES